MTDVGCNDTNVPLSHRDRFPGSAGFLPRKRDWARSANVRIDDQERSDLFVGVQVSHVLPSKAGRETETLARVDGPRHQPR